VHAVFDAPSSKGLRLTKAERSGAILSSRPRARTSATPVGDLRPPRKANSR